MASPIEKASAGAGGMRAGNLRPEIIIIRTDEAHRNYREMNSDAVKAHIAWLKESIRTEGVKDPIDVSFSDDKWYLEAGHCRLTACQQLRKEGWDGYIPCFQIKGDEVAIAKKNLLENTGLTPTLLEIGVQVQRLVNFGLGMEEISKCIPPSITTDPAKALKIAKKALDLNQAPIAVKEAVRRGEVSAPAAIAIAKKSPLRAAEIIEEQVRTAKEKGQKTAKRPKGAGKATKAKEAEAVRYRSLEKIGDAMAEEIMSTPWDEDKMEKLAKEWFGARKAGS